MPTTAKALREKRAEVAKSIRRLADSANDEQRDFSAEEQGNWDAANADYDRLSSEIERAERAERVTADQDSVAGDRRIGRGDLDGNPADRESRDSAGDQRSPRDADHSHDAREARAQRQRERDVNDALQAWGLHGRDDQRSCGERALAACRAAQIRPSCPEIVLRLDRGRSYRQTQHEVRALSAISGSAGGYTVPEGFVSSLERAMLFFGGMRQVASVITTAAGNDLPWPTTNDTSNTGELVGENATVNPQDVTFGQLMLRAYKFSSKLVRVPYELLRDSAFDFATELGSILGERLGRIQNTYFTVGTGASQPNGLVTAATLGVTAASATAIAADEFFDLLHSVDVAYRDGAGWMLRDSTLKAARKLKDSQNRYLWEPGLNGGVANFLLGYPITVNNDVAAIATTNKTVLFGQLAKYRIRDVDEVRVRRLEERYADNDQVGFIAFLAGDGNLIDAGTAPVKYLQQA